MIDGWWHIIPDSWLGLSVLEKGWNYTRCSFSWDTKFVSTSWSLGWIKKVDGLFNCVCDNIEWVAWTRNITCVYSIQLGCATATSLSGYFIKAAAWTYWKYSRIFINQQIGQVGGFACFKISLGNFRFLFTVGSIWGACTPFLQTRYMLAAPSVKSLCHLGIMCTPFSKSWIRLCFWSDQNCTGESCVGCSFHVCVPGVYWSGHCSSRRS